MKKLIAACAAACFASSAFAAVEVAPAPKTSQQNKMTTCNADATGKKGDERKAFMKTCLSAKPALTAQQSKMQTCNVDAKGMKGDARKSFMKTCLSGPQ